MDGHLALDHGALAGAQARIVGIHDDLRQRRAALGAAADDLLTGGWRGVAADQYAEAWAQWQGAADQVLASLLDLSVAMSLAAVELDIADYQSASGAIGLAARLGARIGAA